MRRIATSKQDGRIRAPGDQLLASMLVAMIVVVPTIFLRTTVDSFVMPKLTAFWVLAVGALFVCAYRVAVSGVVERGPRSLTIGSLVFLGALALTVGLSSQPWLAFTGLTVRGAGALSYAFCISLLHVVFRLSRRRSAQPLVAAFVVAHLLVVLYVLLQAGGFDPIDWRGDLAHIGNPVFSTLGNANFSAGYLGLTFPLLVWVAFGSSYSRLLRVAGGAVVGASAVALIRLDSFQGPMAALVAVLVLCQWVTSRNRPDRIVAGAIAAPVVLVICGLPFAGRSLNGATLLVLMVLLAGCSELGIRWDSRSHEQERDGVPEPANRKRPWTTLVAASGCIGFVVFLLRGRLLEQLESGLEHRAEFWDISFSIFSASPLVGRGLETFTTYFSPLRSTGHAVNFEAVLSDSPHSVPLSILLGGGVVLASAYLALLVLIGYFGLRAVRTTTGAERRLYGAVLAAWFAYQVQSTVSIDVPGLIYTQWILAGILVAGGTPKSLPRWKLPWKGSGQRTSAVSRRHVSVRQLLPAVVIAICFLLCLSPLIRPMRANMAAYQAQRAIAQYDLQTAGDELLKAIDLQPRNGVYRATMASVYQKSGLLLLAFEQRERVARLNPGDPYAAIEAARAARWLGQVETIEYWYTRALENEPHGSIVLSELAGFFAQTGQVDRANQLLNYFGSLRTPNRNSWQTASEVHSFLGNEEEANHARGCATEYSEAKVTSCSGYTS